MEMSNEGSVAQKTAQHFESNHHEEIITAASAKILFSRNRSGGQNLIK